MTREYHLTGATNLGRRISRRLSMSVAKVPVFIQSRFRTDDIVNIDSNQGAGSTGGQQGTAAGLMMRWPQQLRRSRPVTLHIVLPNGIERTITSTGKCTVKQAVSPVALELHICEFRLRMSDTLAIVSPSAEASLLDGDTVLLEDATRVRDERGETDSRFRLTEDLLDTEREFMISLRTIYDVYARPLRKLCSISDEEQKQLFGGIEPVLSVSNMLLTKLEDALSSWDPHETRIGSLFSKQFWNQFEEYYRFFSQAKELLREKHCRDEEFAEICKLRQGAALHTIDSLLDLPIQRLASYERYFQDLLCETAADHPDLDEVHKARDKAQELVKRCEEEINQLDRVQNLFPNDQLYLHDKDALSLKMKGLIRKRSTTAARLQRAFSAKSLGRTSTPPTTPTTSSSSTMDTIDGSCNTSPAPAPKRQFIMEASVQFVNGLQVQERHLFLFNDLLLIAKARSGGHFKLKDKVRISELWLDAVAVDEVAEGSAVTKSRDTSFVIGWPPSVNLVAIFSSAALRDLWWNRLGQAVKEERDREPKATTIQITYHDAVQAIEYFKTLSVTPTETVRDVIKLALSHLEMSGTADVNSFRLWLKTGSASSSATGVGVSSSVEGDSSSSSTPYPLIGHELPFAIKMNCLRDYICRSASENDNEGSGLDMLDHCNNIYNADPATRCQFILRSVQKPAYTAKLSEGAKGASKTKKSPTRIQKVFRRVQSKPDSLETVGAITQAAGAYFAQPLQKIFLAAGDQIPAPILEMLLELRAKGPHTVGIFRKSANARQVREIRERIDSGLRMDWSTVNAVVTAVVFKDFLRSLPDSLLGSAYYDQWLQVAAVDGQEVSIDKIKGLCDRLPSANVTLLRHFMCVLLHITANSTQNMMSASNLAVCVGPSLLWAPLPATSTTATPSAGLNPALALSAEATASKQVPALVAVLIEKCALLFGAETVNLLSEKSSVPTATTTPAAVPLEIRRTSAISNGSVPSSSRNKAPVQKHMARHGLMQHDSGNEESDSLHSLYHSDIRRDDSSIDSLERELLGDHHHHHHHHVHSSAIHMRRDKMSVTNLSRDSGLTLSDTQLYTPDEDMEEGSESSSSGRGSDRDKSRNGMVAMRPRTATTTGVSTTTTPNSSSRIDQARSMYAVPSSTQRIADNGIYGKLNSIPSSYTPVYSDQRVLRKLSDDVVYAVPKATPTVVLAEEFVQSQSSSSFQRQDWFRRKSHNRTKSQSGGVKFDDECDHDAPRLRRSASDESLANVTSSDMLYHHHHHNPYHHHQNGMSNSKKPASHRKGRAPAPPRSSVMDCMELSRRSNSVAQLDGGDSGMRFINQDEPDRRSHHHSSNKNGSSSVRSSGQTSLRPSLSTPHINNGGDRSYDSSTLSDDDSTPHVSRSNSRGSKDYRAVNSAWESAYGALTVPVPAPIHIIVSQDGTGSIVYNKSGGGSSSRSSHSNRMSNHGDHRSRQMQHQQRQNVTHSAPSATAPSSRSYCATPPTGRYGDYDTVIYAGRRSQQQQQKQDSCARNTSTTPDIPSYEEAMLIRRCQRQPANGNGTNWTTWKDRSPSSNLIQVHASPIRLKGQQQQSEAPPLPPKTDPIPPLPPKQRIHLRPSKTAEHVSSNRPRPVTIHMDASILSSLDSNTPPSLPKKERRGNNVSVVSIENSYTPLHRSFAFSTHNLRTAMENGKGGEDWTKEEHHLDEEEEKNRRDKDMQTSGHWAQFCEIETQTSLSPQPSLTTTNNTSSSDEATSAPAKKTVGRYEKNTGRSKSKQVVEVDRSRPRMRDSSTGRDAMVVHRSHSLPPMDKTSSDESEVDEPLEKTKNVINRKQQQDGNATSQALRRAEISWSVSQLRAIFNGNATNSTGTTPPPYRSPPAHLQPSSQQRQRSESTDSYGEESYV